MPIAKLPTVEEVLEILRESTPEAYHQSIFGDPEGSIALYRAVAKIMHEVARRTNRQSQASFYLPHTLQREVPATSGRRATLTATIRRTVNLDQPRIVEAGKMILAGLRGRRYRNTRTVEWLPYDEQPAKELVFEAEAVGFHWNLEHVADPSGTLTKPGTTTHDPDLLTFARHSVGRTALGGSILPPDLDSENSQIVDTGIAPTFSAMDVGLYVKIEVAANTPNVGRELRIVHYRQALEAVPPGSITFPRTVLADDTPQKAKIFAAHADDGGVFTNETVAAQESSPDDMTLLPAAPAVADAYYYGGADPFSSLVLTVSTAGVWDGTLAWEYWDGGAWAALADLVDGTNRYQQPGRSEVTWQVPASWATTVVNGVSAYYVRARVSAFVSVTTQPLGQFATIRVPFPLDTTIPEDGTVQWTLQDWVDLGFEIESATAATGGRDDDLALLGGERGIQQQTNEEDDDFRKRAARLADSVSPLAIQRAINRLLAIYGYRGLAKDVGDGFPGFFWDVDAYDYYQPGDAFPENPYHVFLDADEAGCHFFVCVPYLGQGDYGLFFDEGPSLKLPDGEHLGPAWEHSFYDGTATQGEATYRAVWEMVNRLRAGGVCFTLLRDPRLNDPECPF